MMPTSERMPTRTLTETTNDATRSKNSDSAGSLPGRGGHRLFDAESDVSSAKQRLRQKNRRSSGKERCRVWQNYESARGPKAANGKAGYQPAREALRGHDSLCRLFG